MAIVEICTKFNITPEQFDKATYCVTNGTGFYIVESQSEVGTEYHVKYNRQFGKLTCTCKAGQNGIPCWHERAALAAQEHHKAEQAARRQAEQAEIEASELYQFEQAFVELERALDKLDEIAAESDRKEQARRDLERTAYNNYCLSMGI